MSMSEDIVRDYHRRTAHRFERYADGPGALDWDAQPDPFRRFDGGATTALPLAADGLATAFSDLGRAPAQPLDAEHLGILLELSFAISAWKAFGPDRWALRCNPSSGNLHPTEAYVLPLGVQGIMPSLHHYRADLHGLERRCDWSVPTLAAGILVGLSSVHWREAWKYGERAFRYSQLDTGHAIAAVRYAAAALGWHCALLRAWGSRDIAALLGLDRADDYAGVEPESAEVLLWVHAGDARPPEKTLLLDAARNGIWSGKASLLDPRPMYTWPVIDAVDVASAIPPSPTPAPDAAAQAPPMDAACAEPAATIIRRRRSAQRFDARPTLPAADLYRMLDATLPRPHLPPWGEELPTRTHLVLFVHRVEGLRPGLYALPRRAGAQPMLQGAMRAEFAWERMEAAGLPLYALIHANARAVARRLCCHQDIAADSAFAVLMLGEFDAALTEGPWTYRHLFWEAGMIGQALYLQAEAAGVRGTGIGCYFDPAVHDMLGLADSHLQSMYHFTVGTPMLDSRLQTLPPYPPRRG